MICRSLSRSKRVVFFNGDFVPERKAVVSIFDTAIATGEKVVEVMRTFNHIPHEIDEHVKRLFEGLSRLDLKISETPADIKALILETIKRNAKECPSYIDWQIICYVSRGPASHFEIIPAAELKPTLIIQCMPLVKRIGKMAYKYEKGIELVTVKQRVIPNSVIAPQLKSNGRMDHVMARLEAKKISPSASGVLLDDQNYITESTGASLFFVKKGNIYTADTTRVLNGITRSLVFKLAKKLRIKIYEKKITIKDAMAADEAFITSTVICIVHAKSFNKKLYGNGSIGPITKRIRQAFIKEVGQDYVKTAQQYAAVMNSIK